MLQHQGFPGPVIGVVVATRVSQPQSGSATLPAPKKPADFVLPPFEQELAHAMGDSLRALLDSTPLGAGNAPYIESLYEQFLADPASVEAKWRDYSQ